jgi:hypothetical protein
VIIAIAIAVARLVGASQHTEQPMEPVSFSVTHIEDAHPQIIHINNLDDGPRAIVLPRAQSEGADSSRPIRIFNALGEGVQEIAQPLK